MDYNSYKNTPVDGIGTNKARKKVFVNNGVLKARYPVDRKLEEIRDNKVTFAPKVEGYRYYFPTLFKIELEHLWAKLLLNTGLPQGKVWMV